MTIDELYMWAKEHNALNLPIGLQFQDHGGNYEGDTWVEWSWEIRVSVQHDDSNAPYVLLE